MKTVTALTSLLALLSIQSASSAHAIALSGQNEVPAIDSTVTGTATIDLLEDGTIKYNVTLVNPDGVLLLGAAGAHIHCGASGENGPVVAFLAQPVDGGLLTSPLGRSGVLDDSSIVDDTCGATIAMLYASIKAGGTYINVHSTENPTGEVRGQIVGKVISVSLSGEEEVPTVTSNVTGTATIDLLSDGTIKYFVNVLNPDGVELLGASGAHIHCGASGENGPVVAFLTQPVDGGMLMSPVQFSGVLNVTSIVDDACGATIAMLYASIRAGGVYINVHSTENPDGVVRGQIPEPTPLNDAINVSLTGENEVPAINSAVTGMMTIQQFSDSSLEFSANLLNPDGVELLGAAGAHIHCGAIGANGPVVAFLTQPVEGGRMEEEVNFSGFLDATSILDEACGATIDLLYKSIMEGRTYVNVHSTKNPDGEVRGQTLTSVMAPDSASPNFKFRSAFVGVVVALITVVTM
jgi:Cu/Zn superoxide dismutase